MSTDVLFEEREIGLDAGTLNKICILQTKLTGSDEQNEVCSPGGRSLPVALTSWTLLNSDEVKEGIFGKVGEDPNLKITRQNFLKYLLLKTYFDMSYLGNSCKNSTKNSCISFTQNLSNCYRIVPFIISTYSSLTIVHLSKARNRTMITILSPSPQFIFIFC